MLFEYSELRAVGETSNNTICTWFLHPNGPIRVPDPLAGLVICGFTKHGKAAM